MSVIINTFPNITPIDIKFFTSAPYKDNKLRRAKIIVLTGALSNYPPFLKLSTENRNQKVIDLERSCHNFAVRKSKENNIRSSWQTPEFVRIYNTTVLEKARSLDFTENQFLVPLFIDGKVDSNKIAEMTIEDMEPSRYESIKKYIEERKTQTITSKTSMLYECPNCKRKECILQSVQLRGLDEGKDLQATCTFCGNMWLARN